MTGKGQPDPACAPDVLPGDDGPARQAAASQEAEPALQWDAAGESLPQAQVDPQAYARALSLLARREHSRRELADKLTARDVTEDDCEAILDRLLAAGYQCDERFARMLVRSRVGQGHGPVRIQAELRMVHRIEDAVIRQVMDEEGADWQALALDLCRRRYRTPPASHAERIKRANFLARRGFPASIARAAVDAGPEVD